jgi:hypothetical protein
MKGPATQALPKAEPRVDLDLTRERLLKLGLVHASDLLADHVATATKDALPPHRFLDRLLEDELVHRDDRRVKTSLRLSGLPPGHTLRVSTLASNRRSSAAGLRPWRPASGFARRNRC